MGVPRREWAHVTENRRLAADHVLLVLESPSIWRDAQPGQFIQVSLPADAGGPLLPRPFSFLETREGRISLLLRSVGRGTRLMANSTVGSGMWVFGPLGKGFRDYAQDPRPLVLVGGGVGVPPLYHLVTGLPSERSVEVFIGARSADGVLQAPEFEQRGCQVHVATDDGSGGHHGLVTDLLARRLEAGPTPLILACGPTPMLAGTARLAHAHGAQCQAALEAPMACGFGACLGCPVRLHGQQESPRYALVCTDGPVFESREVAWAQE